jgi:hypothetical protein
MPSELPQHSPSLTERRDALDVRALPVTSAAMAGGWQQPRGFTIVVPVRPAQVEALREVLSEVDAEARKGKTDPTNPLSKLPGLHFLRWVLLPDRVRERGIPVPPSLVLWTVFDESRDQHLLDLATHARDMLDRIYVHCEGYPADGAAGRPSPTGIAKFLKDHEDHGQAAPYVGTPGVTVAMVENEERLTTMLADFVRETKRNDPSMPNTHVFLAAQRFVESDEFAEKDPTFAAFARAAPAAPPRPISLFLLFGLGLAAVVGIGILIWWRLPPIALARYVRSLAALLACAITIGGVWAAVVLRWLEPRDALRWVPESARFFAEHNARIRERDNELAGMNRMTIVTDVKPGLVRRVTMRAVLWLVALRASRNFEGRLQGVETIHFAQWRLVDGGRRLLFMSNYDGSALGYLADFSENATPGVNAIWSSTNGFPPTTAIVGEGARDLEEFQNAARVHQIVTDVWYCGYTDRRFSTRRINDNWRVHRMLRGFPTPPEVDAWVAILEGRR